MPHMTEKQIHHEAVAIAATVRSRIAVPLNTRGQSGSFEGVLLSSRILDAVTNAVVEAVSEEFREDGVPQNAVSGADADYR